MVGDGSVYLRFEESKPHEVQRGGHVRFGKATFLTINDGSSGWAEHLSTASGWGDSWPSVEDWYLPCRYLQARVFVRLNQPEKTVNTEGRRRCAAGSSPAPTFAQGHRSFTQICRSRFWRVLHHGIVNRTKNVQARPAPTPSSKRSPEHAP